MAVASAAAQATPPHERAVLLVAVLATAMVFIDFSAVGVALPAIQRDLHASFAGAQWVIEGYVLFLSALMLVGGAAGDRYGRRMVFALGVALFAVASLLCGLAPDADTLGLARALQGVGGALSAPGALALIAAHVPAGRRGRAIAIWSASTALTSAAGPVVGGLAVDLLSWRWIFLLNLPIAAAVLLVLLRRVPESLPEARGRLDLAGAVLATLGLGALTYGLIEAGHGGFGQAKAWLPVLAGIAALAAFLAVEAVATAPMLPLGLFRSRLFAGINAMTFVLYGALQGALFLLPFNLLQVQAFSPAQTGAAMLPFAIMVALLSRTTGALSERLGARPPLLAGLVLTAAGFALLAGADARADYVRDFLPGTLLAGVGFGILVPPLTGLALDALGPERAGLASAVNNAAARVGGLIGIALLGLLMAQGFADSLLADPRVTALPAEAQAAVASQIDRLAAIEVDGYGSAALRAAIAEAFVAGYRMVMFSCAGCALACLPIAWHAARGGDSANGR